MATWKARFRLHELAVIKLFFRYFSRLPRNEAKCVQRTCFQWGSVSLRSDIKGMELPPANILIQLERQLIALNFAADSFYIMKLCSRLFVLYCRNFPKDDKFRYLIPILTKLGVA